MAALTPENYPTGFLRFTAAFLGQLQKTGFCPDYGLKLLACLSAFAPV